MYTDISNPRKEKKKKSSESALWQDNERTPETNPVLVTRAFFVAGTSAFANMCLDFIQGRLPPGLKNVWFQPRQHAFTQARCIKEKVLTYSRP
ncbi:hypothetical protein TNIN_81281 [Trichonephila inaurata madagascariensis]|uniref:Uncharacterized protein n=1 Tax=Trichonephila inaurata madagascariensis TaxID=2747483 RepID=A0A8X7CE24_9ARAC|nr:hypothetical protein TNIN_81281 [Trichonephila inaurata madagascariensis]